MLHIKDELLKQLLQFDESNKYLVFLGFDAFIDLIAKPIASGHAQDVLTYFTDITNFGCHILERAGLNYSNELELCIGPYTSKIRREYAPCGKCVGMFGGRSQLCCFARLSGD